MVQYTLKNIFFFIRIQLTGIKCWETFAEQIEQKFLDKLEIKSDAIKEGSGVLNKIGTGTSIILGVASGTAIALSIPTFGATAFVGAAVTTLTFAVGKISEAANHSKSRKLKNMIDDFLHSYVQCVILDVAKELSRIFEYQVLQLKETEIEKLADCAVDLMLDLKKGDQFDRNTLIKKVLRDGSVKKTNLWTKNDDKWKAPDVFRKPGLRKMVVTNDRSEFTHHVKKENTCDTQKYGYRSQFLEIKYGSDDGGDDDKRHYFVDSEIDSQYTLDRSEDAAYRPVHILVRRPKVLSDFIASQAQTRTRSLANFLRKKFKCFSEEHVVCPVYRPHIPTDIPNLEKSDLTDSDFSYSDFKNSSLKSCNFTNCVMLFANLRKVNMSGSALKDSLICYSDLAEVDATCCDWLETSILCSCVDDMDVSGGNYGAITWGKTRIRNLKTGQRPREEPPLESKNI